jgi:hypothetical protein
MIFYEVFKMNTTYQNITGPYKATLYLAQGDKVKDYCINGNTVEEKVEDLLRLFNDQKNDDI